MPPPDDGCVIPFTDHVSSIELPVDFNTGVFSVVRYMPCSFSSTVPAARLSLRKGDGFILRMENNLSPFVSKCVLFLRPYLLQSEGEFTTQLKKGYLSVFVLSSATVASEEPQLSLCNDAAFYRIIPIRHAFTRKRNTLALTGDRLVHGCAFYRGFRCLFGHCMFVAFPLSHPSLGASPNFYFSFFQLSRQ